MPIRQKSFISILMFLVLVSCCKSSDSKNVVTVKSEVVQSSSSSLDDLNVGSSYKDVKKKTGCGDKSGNIEDGEFKLQGGNSGCEEEAAQAK